ncbi:MAG: hypothetical protein DI535_19850 [Citrobacter freundii]|nr:MAG: hypothetical protein DI535_19850 [Citrobacter freundii]
MKPLLPALLFLGLILPICTLSQTCSTAQGDQVTYGTNNVWIGYVYDNINLTNYFGYVNEGNASSPGFDESFGGDNVNYSTNGCAVNTNTFSIRYRLRKTFTSGSYTFLVGGDDGYRLSIDGGSTWIINRWVDQTYATTSTSVALNGTYDIVLEYYENGGSNRISFALTQDCTGTENTTVYGTNNVWNGYIYSGTNFDTYKGLVHEGTTSAPDFDEGFGGDNVLYPTSTCNVLTEYFSARYRLRKTFPAGQYRFVVGADDGYRFSIDGGATWVINNWAAHSYTSTTYTVNITGSRDLVLEYFENGSQNRLTFALQTLVLLPVNLVSFSGQEQNGATDLRWKITRDSDPQWFDIQRSNDGNSFATVNRLQGQSGSILTSDISYQYKDVLSAAGTYYYRLKMTDRSGAISFSPTIMVDSRNAQNSPTKVFPTVVNGSALYLQPGKRLQQGWYAIYDLSGKLVYKQSPGKLDAGQVINVFPNKSSLSRGTYILKLRDGDEEVSQHRFIIPD